MNLPSLKSDKDNIGGKNVPVDAASLYYIFSFAFSRIPFREKVSGVAGTYCLGELLQKKLGESKKKYYSSVQFHQSEETESPMIRSAIYIPFRHLSIDVLPEPVEIIPLGSGFKRCQLVLFESGMGLITITVEPDIAPTIDNLSHVARRDSLPLIKPRNKNVDKSQKKSLHDIFRDEVTHLCRNINEIIAELDDRTQIRLRKLYPNLACLNNQMDIASGLAIQKFSISFIDADEELIWHDHKDRVRGTDVFQEPSVAFLLKVATDYRDAIDPNSPKREEVEHVVSSILHTNLREQMDASHALEHEGNDLRSLCSDKRFRTFLHSNCLLVLHSEEQDSDQLKEFMFGIFRTYCAVRGCWHMYNIVNEQLDNSTNSLFSQFMERPYPTVGDEFFLRKQYEAIVNRACFLSSLAVEDPLVRGIRLTEYGPLYDEAAYIFRLDEIRQLVKYKLDELDKFYNMINAYNLRLQYTQLPSSKTSSTFLRFALVFAFIGIVSKWQLPNWLTPHQAFWVSSIFLILALVCTAAWIILILLGRKR